MKRYHPIVPRGLALPALLLVTPLAAQEPTQDLETVTGHCQLKETEQQ